jgi:hypothetical protein
VTVSLRKTLLAGGLLLTVLVTVSIDAAAAPLLHCHLQQGDTVTDTQTAPTTDPYTVAAQRINHFRFKAVVVGDTDHVDYVNLYTYYDTGNGATNDIRLLQEAKYSAPQVPGGTASASLTGTVYLYEPSLGREFSYNCALRGDGA